MACDRQTLGGEQQLVSIARAFASDPDILLFDEPAAKLDFHKQAIMLAMLGQLAAKRRLTIVMITHEPTHALEIGDRAILLHGSGRCEEDRWPLRQYCRDEGGAYRVPDRDPPPFYLPLDPGYKTGIQMCGTGMFHVE